MKRIPNILAAVALFLGVSTAAQAQTVEEQYPYNFVTLQGGAQGTFTNYDFTKLLTPQVAVSAGRYFNSKVGARLHVQGWQGKSALTDTYEFNAVTGDLDLLLNMTNIINPNRRSNKFDWVLLAGFGANYTWDYDEIDAQVKAIQPAAVYGKTHSSFNGRLGTQLNYNVGRNFAIGLEVDANGKNDLFNLKTNDHVDWQVAAFLGLTYKFGLKKKQQPAPVQEVVEEPAPVPEPKPVVVEKKPEPKPVVEKKDEPLKETLYYAIRITDPNSDAEINKVAEWCKKYPEKSITISGYADKGTGNPRINAKYAAQRADKVAKKLQQLGIPASRMQVASYGDTVQPFADNDSNRCVIVVGE